MDLSFLDRRPIIVAIAGSNGAGKSTFYHAHFAETDLRSINADDLAAELKIDPYEAAEVATEMAEMAEIPLAGMGLLVYLAQPVNNYRLAKESRFRSKIFAK